MTSSNTPNQVDALDDLIEQIWMLGVEHQSRTVPEMDKMLAKYKAKLSALLVEAERRGEVYQIKMQQHWQNLHNISIEPDDLQHIADSLEQSPDQPLARVMLQELEKQRGVTE